MATESNLGGRNPDQPGTGSGDRDPTAGRPNATTTDPMTSRAPDVVNEKQRQEQEEKKRKEQEQNETK